MSEIIVLVRLVLSAFLGALVGMEREFHGRAAGLRTHILVCIGSALFTLTSLLISVKYSNLGIIDPSRIAA